ncbi:hypothetical protein Gorai_022920 [Gossypium raimondii]|uniref:DUF4283 domain-containing protein n=1 Tax=Gossypium raimondii TaxID=29730 RepID=A0A7J8NV55_GOSRA|nr:hypothetical protein [Gossypium raimondii]
MGSKLDSRKENNMEKGFDLKDGDVITEVVDEILLITFSDRVHQFIEWKNQLMDLENEFFLVRFHDIDDYNNVLAGGPWVVYGNYLTVRPWSPNFSTTCTDVNVQVVWICLPGLLEGLYSEKCVEEEAFGLWMLVEKHRRRKGRSSGDAKSDDQDAIKEGLDFLLLTRKVNCDHAGVLSGKELLGKMVGKENSLFYFSAGFVARDMPESSSANSVELVE